MMQKSASNGSHEISCVGVLEGKGVGEREVFVGRTFVFTMTGTEVASIFAFAQDATKNNMRRFKIRFINTHFGVRRQADEFARPSTIEQSLKYTMPMDDIYKTYLHNPPHFFVPNAMYMVTGAILHNEHLLTENKRKEFVLQTLFERAKLLNWTLQAWVVLNNHYHFIGRAPENALTLEKLIRQIHSITAIEINRWDKIPGRQVWFNYWDSCLLHERSYLARLHYVHMNPIKHGLADNAINYPFSSYRWFIEQGDEALKQQVFAQPIDRVKILDDF